MLIVAFALPKGIPIMQVMGGKHAPFVVEDVRILPYLGIPSFSNLLNAMDEPGSNLQPRKSPVRLLQRYVIVRRRFLRVQTSTARPRIFRAGRP